MYMFNALGVNWAGTLLGCVAAVLIPIPSTSFRSTYLYSWYEISLRTSLPFNQG